VDHVIGHVRKLGAAADTMHAHGSVVRQEVEHLLIAMQFQDRVSQILVGVDDNMAHLQSALQSLDVEPLPTSADWLHDLNQTSKMDDQIY
jgi:methyl-accepting chemotaxis protein